MKRQPRRRFLIDSLGGLGSAWLVSRWPAPAPAPAPVGTAPAPFVFLSPEQAREIDALAAQIIPSDANPGAREAGVIYYIDGALATFDREERDTYVAGLADLHARAAERFPPARRFSELLPKQQIELLTAIEDTRFFKTVRLHTVEGFLANPEYGGNRGKIGWKWIGFDDRFAFQPPFGFYDRDA